MKDKISQYIDSNVIEYKFLTYETQNKVKRLCFECLMNNKSVDDFKYELYKVFGVLKEDLKNKENKSIKELEAMVVEANALKKATTEYAVDKENINAIIKDLNTKARVDSKEVFIARIKNFYSSTKKTMEKEYIKEKEYLSSKVSKYDKVEKVVPYYTKEGTIKAHLDMASYESMCYNTRLTRNAWYKTFENAMLTDNSLVYVYSHPWSCPMCQEWQGKIYTLNYEDKRYPNIEEAYAGGLLHPNCKHVIVSYAGQSETDEYTSGYWEEMYKDRQKKQSLELKRSRLLSDKEIYNKLGNGSEVDKCSIKINKLEEEINILNEKISYNN